MNEAWSEMVLRCGVEIPLRDMTKKRERLGRLIR